MKGRWLLLLLLAALAAAFFAFDVHEQLHLDALKARQAEFQSFRREHPLVAATLFVPAYIAMATLPIPGAALLALLAGALFGLLWGVLIVSFCGTLGAGVSFVTSRYLLREALHRRYAGWVRRIDEGLARDGMLYLFTLRLLPVLPFFLLNLLFGLSAMRLRTFCLVTLLGMLPGAVVLVNAGGQLARLEGLSGVLSPPLLASFAVLALFPWLVRGVLRASGRADAARKG